MFPRSTIREQPCFVKTVDFSGVETYSPGRHQPSVLQSI
jgi:hypothetical protein